MKLDYVMKLDYAMKLFLIDLLTKMRLKVIESRSYRAVVRPLEFTKKQVLIQGVSIRRSFSKGMKLAN